MQCAETALLEAWKTQQPTVVYAEGRAAELAAGWDLEGQLANAMEQGNLVLAYQPKLSLAKLEVVGCEALMRWNRPDAGNVPPEIFIDLAEMTGQIDPLTRFAFDRALRQLGEWPRSLNTIRVAINVTPSIIAMDGSSTIFAPNLSICRTLRVARSAPESPLGKPMKFSIFEEPAACPPGPRRSSTIVETPSDAA